MPKLNVIVRYTDTLTAKGSAKAMVQSICRRYKPMLQSIMQWFIALLRAATQQLITGQQAAAATGQPNAKWWTAEPYKSLIRQKEAVLQLTGIISLVLKKVSLNPPSLHIYLYKALISSDY